MKNLLNIRFGFMEIIGIFLLGLTCFIVSVYLQYRSAAGVLNVEIETDTKGIFQLFWDSDKKGYSEDNSYPAEIDTSPMAISIALPSLATVSHLRIDPNNLASVVMLNKFQLTFSDGKTVDLLPLLISKTKVMQRQQLDFVVDNKKKSLVIKTFGTDPYFQYKLPFLKCFHLQWKKPLLFFVIFCLSMTIILNQNILKGSKQDGILFISLDDKQYFNFLKISSTFNNKSPRIWREMRNQRVIYKIEFKKVKPDFVVKLVQQISYEIPDSFVFFQYQRSCEI